MKTLSVIVPTYNNGKYLSDLIHSIFGGVTSLGVAKAQTRLPDQIVIMDDASTDDTQQIVHELSKVFPIDYYRLAVNSGTAIACNEAISRATGDAIARIDADDMREFRSFEFMFDLLVANPNKIIYDDVTLFGPHGRHSKIWKLPEYDFEKLIEKNFIHAGIMFPKIAWEICGGYPKEFAKGRDDWAFNVALGLSGYTGIHLDYPGYLYRRAGQNRTLRNTSQKHEMMFQEMMRNRFSEVYQRRAEMGCTNCGGRKIVTNPSVSKAAKILAGAEGMTLLEYVGSSYGKQTFHGPVSGRAYKFGQTSPIKNVDNRDLISEDGYGLLDMFEHGKSLFKIYEAPEEISSPTQAHSSAVVSKEPEVKETKPVEVIENKAEEIDEVDVIQAGQVSGIGKVTVTKLAEAGVKTWEQFYFTETSTLAEVIGKTEEVVDAIKATLV